MVSRGDWLGKPANLKVENNSAVGYVESFLRGWSFTICEGVGGGGDVQNLHCFWGAFSEKEALPGGSFHEKWYQRNIFVSV